MLATTDDFDESYDWVFGRKDPPPRYAVAQNNISISSAPAVIAARGDRHT